MALSARPPLRRPPPPSASRTLTGMEKVVPPGMPSPQQSTHSSPPDTDKPLPEWPGPPRRSSSVYSGNSGYTEIIDLYTNWKADDEPAAPNALQPIAYRETLTGLLARRFTESSSPISPLAIPHFAKHVVSIPSLHLTSENSPTTSAVAAKAEPSFIEFSRSLQAERSDMISPLSSLASPHYAVVSHDTFWQPSLRSSPEFHAVTFDYERDHLPDEVSQRTSDIVNSNFVHPSLHLARSNRSSYYQSMGMLKVDCGSEMVLSEQGSSSKFSSTSSSDSSFVVYTGVRESIRAIIRSKMGKKNSVEKGKEKAFSVASIKDHVANSDLPWQTERKFSWVSSRKSSLQEGVSSLLRILSLTNQSSPNKSTPRVRQKQLAVPLTPYQKYGTAVWHNSQRKKRRQARAARAARKSAMPMSGIRRLPTQNRRKNPHSRSSEVLTAFDSGRNQILDALDETKQKIGRTKSEKSTGAPKNSITLQGYGEKQEARHRLFRSNSEKRREKLKKSITLVELVDPNRIFR
jgi:hypothetical protein